MADEDEGYIRAAVASDNRFRDLQEAIAIQNDMENNPTIRALFAYFRADAEAAMVELADTSPLDAKAIGLLSVRTGIYIRVKRILETVQMRGNLAERSLRSNGTERFSDE